LIGFGLWVSAFVLEMSWVGHQPLSPDRLHLNAIDNHGVMYVSNADLHWLYGLRGVVSRCLYWAPSCKGSQKDWRSGAYRRGADLSLRLR